MLSKSKKNNKESQFEYICIGFIQAGVKEIFIIET